ncbi:hypothetical protein, partial [Enterobacter asburiae]|uniref:hypothetical protein n=1 Tax=Enterobacter asburiae TaxID=61645 RepID=UPI000AB3A411
WLMMSLWDALRMNMMISYQELVRTFPKQSTISGELTFRAIVTVALQRFKQKRGFVPADITIENTKKVTRMLEKIHSKYTVKH